MVAHKQAFCGALELTGEELAAWDAAYAEACAEYDGRQESAEVVEAFATASKVFGIDSGRREWVATNRAAHAVINMRRHYSS